MLLTWVVAINSTRNEEFLVKTLEDQQKIYVVFIRLISTLGALGHYAIWKYINQNWMEGVFYKVYFNINSIFSIINCVGIM